MAAGNVFWDAIARLYNSESGTSHIIRTNDELRVWNDIGSAVKFPKGRVIIGSDVVPDCFYIVKSGVVMAYEELDNGSELAYFFMERNSVLLEANLILSKAPGVSFRALEDSMLIRVTREQLLRALEDNPMVLISLLSSVSNKFLDAMDANREMKKHDAYWRVCGLLIEFAEKYGAQYDGKVLIRRRISVQLITDMLGINRATTVRSMRQLRDLGLVERINGYYCVRSIEALRRHQENNA